MILLRAGGKHDSHGLELLLGKRTDQARFMAGVWVFPGGAVDGSETDDAAHRATALRELEEEVGVKLDDPGALVPFSRWITPTEVKTRFDTMFYLAKAPPHCKPEPDGEEIVDSIWVSPADALLKHQRDELLLVFPTIKQLEQLEKFSSLDEAFTKTAATEVQPILPIIIPPDGDRELRVLLPGDPDYPG